MGKKSGPKAPPPPPDYSPQRDQYVQQQNKYREEQAAKYNEAINFFNEQLSGYGGQINELGDLLGGLDIDYNVDTLSGYGDTIDDIQSLLGDFLTGDVSGFNAYTPPTAPLPTSAFDSDDPAAAFLQSDKYKNIAETQKQMYPDLVYNSFGLPTNPNFSPTGTSYGQQVSLATPTLASLNFQQANKFLQELAELEAQIGSLESGRQSELDRINEYFGGYVDDFNNYDIDVAYDPLSTDFDKYMALVEKAQNELGGFESKLDFSGNLSDAQKELDELKAIISGRQEEKAAEESRIEGFGTSLDERLDALQDTIDGLGIADVEDVTSYTDQLEALRDEIKDFDSELDFDFTGDTSTAFELEDALSALQDKRAAEEARIEAFYDKYDALLQSGTKGVNRMDLYDLYAIEDAQTDLDNFIKDLTGFESELDFDFSDLIAGADDPQAVLTQLLADREGKLAKEQADVDAILEQISGVADYDENTMNMLKNNLIDELGDLGKYTGGISGNQESIEGGLDSIDDLLDTLFQKRGTIEQEALEALQGYRDQDFNTLDDVSAAEELLNTILSSAETYKATQAQDELDLIKELLGDERGRLQSDVDAVEAREQAGVDAVEPLLDAYGNLLFPTVADGQQDILTEEALQAYLANLDDEDDLENMNYNASSFARNLLAQGV